MVTLTLPRAGEHPEYWSVIKQLIGAQIEIDKIIRLSAPGDPGAQRDLEGCPMPTVLFVGEGRPLTAVLGRRDVLVWLGWTER